MWKCASSLKKIQFKKWGWFWFADWWFPQRHVSQPQICIGWKLYSTYVFYTQTGKIMMHYAHNWNPSPWILFRTLSDNHYAIFRIGWPWSATASLLLSCTLPVSLKFDALLWVWSEHARVKMFADYIYVRNVNREKATFERLPIYSTLGWP